MPDPFGSIIIFSFERVPLISASAIVKPSVIKLPDVVKLPVTFVFAFNSIVPVPLGSNVIAALLGELIVDPTAVKSPKLSPPEALIVTTPAESVEVVTLSPPWMYKFESIPTCIVALSSATTPKVASLKLMKFESN